MSKLTIRLLDVSVFCEGGMTVAIYFSMKRLPHFTEKSKIRRGECKLTN